MQLRATNNSAALTGLAAGVFGVLFGARVDSGEPLWILLATAAVAAPPYFFVFGLRRCDMVGLWMFQPALLKRILLWFAGAMCVGTVAQLYFLIRAGGLA